MNDDFVYRALPKVPKDFAQSLYARISADNTLALPQPRRFPGIRSLRRWQVALIILGLILVVAWAQVVVFRIRYVPIGDLWLVEIARTTQNAPGANQATVFVPTPRQLPTVIIDGIVREAWYYDFLSPTWIPEGFSKVEVPPSMISYEESMGLWSNDAGERIRLYAVPQAGGMHPYAPSGIYEEVQVNGQPAILIYGRLALKKPSENSRKWDNALGFQLSWSLGESIYTLETFGSYLSEYDLIRMAESMKIAPRWSP